MEGTSADFLSGVPVEVDPQRIERELGALWKPASDAEGGEGAVVRACLTNLVVFAPEARDLERIRATLIELARRHPHRTILLSIGASGGEPAPPGGAPPIRGLRAAVSALCHAPRAGVAPVCSEEIRLLAPPGDAELLAGAIDPLLVPDLPVVLWAAGDPSHALLPTLSEHAETLIADSRNARSALDTWRALAPRLGAGDPLRIVDLAWRSTASWRRAVADVFDETAVRELLASLSGVAFEVAGHEEPSPPPETALLAGWVLARLLWKIERVEPAAEGWRVSCREPSGKPATLRLGASKKRAGIGPGAPVALRFLTGESLSEPHVDIAIDPDDARTARVTWMTRSTCRLPKAHAVHRPSVVELLGDALDRPAGDRGYPGALELALDLLEKAAREEER